MNKKSKKNDTFMSSNDKNDLETSSGGLNQTLESNRQGRYGKFRAMPKKTLPTMSSCDYKFKNDGHSSRNY